MAHKIKIAFLILFLLIGLPISAVIAVPVYGPLQAQNALIEIEVAGLQALARYNIQVQGYATTNAGLRGFPLSGLSVANVVNVSGYYTEGDMPSVSYTLSTTPCTENSGVGDGGGCERSTVNSSYYWYLVPQTSYDARTWGAKSGGTDPYYTSGDTGNALAFNNMFSYISIIANSIATTSGNQGVDITGGGLIYGINYPVSATTSNSYIHDMSFVVLSSTNFPCTTTAGFLILNAATRRFARIYVDSNRLPVNSIGDESNGSQKLESLYARHWEGVCSSVTTGSVATTTSGSNIVTITNTSGLSTGMVARGDSAYGISDRTIILQIVNNTSLLLSKAATSSSSSVPLTFDIDPSGIVLGLNNTNTGDEFNNMNSVEWNGGDAENGVNADRYGYALEFTGGANDISVTNTELTGGVVPLYSDFGVGSFRLGMVEIANSNWTTSEPNPYSMLIAPEGGQIQSDGLYINVPVALFTDATVSQTFIATQTKYTAGSGYTENPAAIFQIYVNGTNVNLSNIYIDPFNNYIPNNGYSLYTTYGPGTINANQGVNFGVSSLIAPSAVIAANTKFTSTGSVTASHIGGSYAGTFTSSQTALSATITINGATGLTAPNGWACPAWDETTPADKVTETATTTTTATFSGTVATSDVIGFTCTGY